MNRILRQYGRFWLIALMVLSVAPLAPGQRVVSLSPSLTELVCELGGRSNLVGRSSACDYPESVAEIPVVGGFGQPNLEAVIRAKPDAVIITDIEQAGLIQAMKKMKLDVQVLPCESWSDLMKAAQRVGVILRREEAADAWVTRMEAGKRSVEASNASGPRRPKVFVKIWDDPIITAGQNCYLTELITMAGGENIAVEFDQPYAKISLEWVMKHPPDYILSLMHSEAAINGAHHPLDKLQAAQAGRICDAGPHGLLMRPGPRWLTAVEYLRACFQKNERQDEGQEEGWGE